MNKVFLIKDAVLKIDFGLGFYHYMFILYFRDVQKIGKFPQFSPAQLQQKDNNRQLSTRDRKTLTF